MYQNRLDTIVNIIELQNSRSNNNVIETKPTILLEHKKHYLNQKKNRTILKNMK
jgi:hypothetical protein